MGWFYHNRFVDAVDNAVLSIASPATDALGIVADLAKAQYAKRNAQETSDNMRYAPVGVNTAEWLQAQRRTYASQQEKYALFNARYARDKNDYIKAHATAAKIAGYAGDVGQGSLEALSFAHSMAMRSIGTAELTAFGGGNYTGDLAGNWDITKKTTAGQISTKLLGHGLIAGDTSYEDLWKLGDKTQDEYNPWFATETGTADAVIGWFGDPTVIGGKISKAARLAHTEQRAGDLEALEQGINKPGTTTLWRGEGEHKGPGYANSVDERTGRYFSTDKAKALKHMPEGGRLIRIDVSTDEFNLNLGNKIDNLGKGNYTIPKDWLSKGQVVNPNTGLANLTRRQARVVRERQHLTDAVAHPDGTPRSAMEIATIKSIRRSTAGATISHLLSQANTPEERRIVLLAASGSRAARDQLVAIREDIAQQLDDANRELEVIQDARNMGADAPRTYQSYTMDAGYDVRTGEIVEPPVGKPGTGGKMGTYLGNEPPAATGMNLAPPTGGVGAKLGLDLSDSYFAQLTADKDKLDSLLDNLNRAVGDPDKVEGAIKGRSLVTKDDLGIWNSLQGQRARITQTDMARMAGQKQFSHQNTALGRVYRVMGAPVRFRPTGHVDLHDVDQGLSEVDAWSRQIPLLDAETRQRWIDGFIAAPDDNTRRLALQRIEHEGVNFVARSLGYEHEDIMSLLKNIMNERQRMRARYKERQYGVLEDDTIALHPMMETQLANGATLIDVDQVRRVLKRNSQKYLALKAADHGKDIVIDMGEMYNELWKFQALFRLGYPLRNAADSQMRILSYLGATHYGRVQWENARQTAKYLKGTGIKHVFTGTNEKDINALKEELERHKKNLAKAKRTMPVKTTDPKKWFGVAHEMGKPGAKVKLGQFDGSEVQAKFKAIEEAKRRGLVWTHNTPYHVNAPELRATKDKALASIQARIDELTKEIETPTNTVPRFGQGKVDMGGAYKEFADAFGISDEEARYYVETMSATDAHANIVRRQYEDGLNTVRGSGNWSTKYGHQDGYVDDYLRVVNQHFRQSKITQMLMSGKTPDEVVTYLKSPAGRSLRRRMVFGRDSAEDLVQHNLANLEHVLPREHWEEFSKRAMTGDDVRAIWHDFDRPPINAEQVAFSLGQGPTAMRYGQVRDAYFKWVSKMTDDQMGRHPLYRELYRGQAKRLLKQADPTLKGDLSPVEQRLIEEQARQFAKREMRNTMFDVTQKTDLAHWLRFVMPFYSAWQDAMVKYGRLVVKDPGLLAKVGMLWSAPNDANIKIGKTDFMEVVDARTGKPVTGDKSKFSDNEAVIVPHGWMKAWGKAFGLDTDYTQYISKSSFNIALQGDPIWMPGWGPLAQMPANQWVLHEDSPKAAKIMENMGILPFGPVGDQGFMSWKLGFAGALRINQLPDSRKANMKSMILQSELHKYYEGERDTKPTPKEIQKKYLELYALRWLTNAFSPVSVQFKSPDQLYIDLSHQYDAQIGKKYKNASEADKAFYDEVGADFYIYRQSLSKNETGVQSSSRADAQGRRLKDLIGKYPEFGSLFVGPNNVGAYDPNVYTLQRLRKLNPLTQKTWRDNYDDPAQAFAANNAEIGWIEYEKMNAQITAEMKRRGLHSLNQKGARDLAALKNAWVNQNAGDGGPQWGRDWYHDYKLRDDDRIARLLDAARAAVADKRINTRPDIVALNNYLAARDAIKKTLEQRQAQGGSGTLAGNDDLANIWGAYVGQLTDSSPAFDDLFTRYLEADNLSTVG